MRALRLLAVAATAAVLAACGSSDPDDDTVLEPNPGAGGSESESAETELVGTTWTLEQAVTASGESTAPEESASLTFTEDGRLEASSGCNGYGGEAEVEGDQITLGPIVGTMRACSGVTGQIDQAFSTVLQGTLTASVSGSELTVTNEDGASLTFTAKSGG